MKQRGGRMSISVNCKFYERVQAWCAANGVSVSALVDELLSDLHGGPLPPQREPRIERSYPRANDQERLEKLRSWRVEPPPAPLGQGTPRLSETVHVTWSEAVAELVYDSLPDVAGDTARTRTSSPLRPAEASAVLEAALVRMLDAYERVARESGHCAICRVRSKNARPFVPMLAGESVVAVCLVCVRERRQLDGRRVA